MTDPRRLFRRAFARKQESHWPLCLGSWLVVGLRDGQTADLAREIGVSNDSIEDWARTYGLYFALRRRMQRILCVISGRDPKNRRRYETEYRRNVSELRELRKELHYSKFLAVADAWRAGRLTLPGALDALRSGADGSVRQFQAFIGGGIVTRAKAYKSVERALIRALTFPMPKSDKRILHKALEIAKKRGAS